MSKKPYEPKIVSNFYRKNKMEDLMAMSEEERDIKVDEYLDSYIEYWQKKNKGLDLPDIPTSSINMIRNKRVSKKGYSW